MKFDLLVQAEPRSGQVAEDVPHRRMWVGQRRRRVEFGAGEDQLVVGQRLELGAELVMIMLKATLVSATDQTTIEYVIRRTKEGLSKREII